MNISINKRTTRFIYLTTAAVAMLVCITSMSARDRLKAGLDWSDETVIPLQGMIDPTMAVRVAASIEAVVARDDRELRLLINSPGGSVMAGYLIVSAMMNARAQGVRIICVVPFLAASMAMHILAYCDERNVLGGALLLFHEVRTDASQITPQNAEALREALAILAKPLEDNLFTELGTDIATFRHHNVAETLWPVAVFDVTFPRFGLHIIPFIRMPADQPIFIM